MSSSHLSWTAFYEQLHKFVAARVRSPADADDLVQLVLERAMARAPDTELDNVAGWLFAIARNAVADHYRRQARTLVEAADSLQAEASEAPLGSTEEERGRVIACMEPLLDTLDPADAQILRWVDMQGWSMQSLARELAISLTAAKSRVQRARKAFVKKTQECCAITRDARGRVVQLTPRPVARALECAACADRALSTRRIPS